MSNRHEIRYWNKNS